MGKIIKCPYCGDPVELNPMTTYTTCEHCGEVISKPGKKWKDDENGGKNERKSSD